MSHPLIGQRFGRLVVESVERRPWPEKPIATCKCDCGGKSWPRVNNLKYGSTQSCGCLRAELGRASLERLRRKRHEQMVQLRKAHSDRKEEHDPSLATTHERLA